MPLPRSDQNAGGTQLESTAVSFWSEAKHLSSALKAHEISAAGRVLEGVCISQAGEAYLDSDFGCSDESKP